MSHHLFTSVDQTPLLSHDSEISVKKFQQESTRVFSNQDDFEVLQQSKLHEGYRFSSHRIQSLASLKAVVENETPIPSERFYIFHQLHSWGRLRITHATFQRIFSLHETFSALLDLFCAFGLKTREDGNSWNYFRQLTSNPSTYELCYSVRYVEQNGRGTGDPWSLRQSGVYQKLDAQTGGSTWILLQPAESIQRRLRRSLEELGDGSPDTDPFRYHVLILSSSLRNWNEYIVDLNREVDGLNDKACFSRVGIKKKHDFALTFSDCQQLRLTEQRILHAASALDSYIDTCARCMVLCVARYRPSEHLQSCAICVELAQYLAEARLHRQKITNLLQHVSSTSIMLLKILEYRNDEAIHEGEIARRATLDVMKDVAIETKMENEGVAKIGVQTARDSKTLKALTLIATIYLPATFLATIFSSNLVARLPNGGEHEGDTHFALVGDFWKYVVVLVPMMAITFALIACLEWIWSRTSPGLQNQSPV